MTELLSIIQFCVLRVISTILFSAFFCFLPSFVFRVIPSSCLLSWIIGKYPIHYATLVCSKRLARPATRIQPNSIDLIARTT